MQIIAICKGCDCEIPIVDMFRGPGGMIRVEVDRCRTGGCDPNMCEGCEEVEPLREELEEANETIEKLEGQIKELEAEV